MKRALGKFETAAALSGEHAIWNIVGVLLLEKTPPPETIRKALDILQKRHPLLAARLIIERGRHYFESGNIPKIPLKQIERTSDQQWTKVAEDDLNYKFEHEHGPLMHCTLVGDGHRQGELILAAQHSIVDGTSIENMLRELMRLCVVINEGRSIEGFEPLSPLPPVETFFPSGFQGFDLQRKSMGYFMAQMSDEVAYQFALRGKRKPPIHLEARGCILPMRTPQKVTAAIVSHARKQRVTLNSVVNAAVLLSVQKHLYAGEAMPFRFMSMADLRPYVEPPAPKNQVACYIAPLRYTTRIDPDDNLWTLAQCINQQIYLSTKKGEKYLASVMGEQFLRMTFTLKKMRMATTAISYGGASQLQRQFGPYKIIGVHGFVSNFGLGPEFSGQVSIFEDELWWDMLYLDSDMDAKKAQQIADEVNQILNLASQN